MTRSPALLLPLFVGLIGVWACEEPATSPPADLMEKTYVIFSPVENAVGSEKGALGSPVTLAGESRPALVAPPPSEFRYRVALPERARLTFAIGIAEVPGRDASVSVRHVRFVVRVGERAADTTVFDRRIHVGRSGQWLDQEADLGPWSGREVWLVFEASIEGIEGAEPAPVAGVFGEPILHDRGRYREGRGAVLISIDTLRRDHMSLYGYPRKTTPGLSALAADEAVVFEDAVSTSSWTLPAHASLFTSLYPSVHGAVNLHVGLSPEWPTLATALAASGFRTQAFVTHVYLSREYGFGEGFDHLEYLPETRAEQVTDRAVRFLTAMGDRDFFLFLHYYDPHWHYDPPSPYDKEFDPAYEGDASGIWWEFKELDSETIDPRDLHHIEALYDGEIRYTDHHVERLFREMKRIGVFDKSLIVVTSDHGEEFLEHGGWEHQKTLYEEQLRIPLLVKFPGGEGGGGRIAGQVSLLDVAPTILSALGVPGPDTFRGRDLFDDVAPERRESWAETEHTVDGSKKFALRIGASEPKAVFSRRGGEVSVELYDLGKDPGEHHLLRDRELRARFEKRLELFLDEARKAREGKRAPPVTLDPKDRDRLRALGYIK